MHSTTQSIKPCDLTVLNKEIMSKGLIEIKPYSYWNQFDLNTIYYFMHTHGIYVLPTLELIEWLKVNIIGSAIEIGAGNGAIGRALGVPITDSKLQDSPEIKAFYEAFNQPTMKYPGDVEQMDAIEAIDKYSPDTVIGAFITHKFKPGMENGNMFGVEEELVLKKVKKYINIGNLTTHKFKPILSLPNQQYAFNWLITRAVNQFENRIFVFEFTDK